MFETFHSMSQYVKVNIGCTILMDEETVHWSAIEKKRKKHRKLDGHKDLNVFDKG